tara:strand:- start:4204 stop:10263 length:6060 start_codon:yes stop_codon:yes gene_type:complete
MVEVKRNRFYERYDMDTTGIVQLNALYKDTPILTNSATFKLEGQAYANRYVVSGVVSDSPQTGAGDVIGGHLRLYCSGTDLSESATLPKISTYKIRDNVSISEGGLQLSTSGSNTDSPGQLDLFTTYVDTTVPYVQENFDGADKTLGEIDFMAINAAGGVTISSKPYFDLSEAEGADATGVVNNLFVGGHGSMFYGSTDDEEGVNFLLYNFGQLAEGNPPLANINITQTDVKHRYSDIMDAKESGTMLSTTAIHKRTGRLFVKPQKKRKPEGLWKNSDDQRTEAAVYTAYPPYWRHSKIKSYIKYDHSMSMPEMGDKETVANPNNTIFNKFGGTIDNTTAWEAGGNQDAPLVQSSIELTKDKYDTGGQSMLMSEYWAFSTTAGNKYSSNIYGVSGAVNNQYLMASMNAVPFPMPLDFALSSQYKDLNGTENIGATNTSLVKPEINITFNIENLDSSPAWRQSPTQTPALMASGSNSPYVIDYVSGSSQGGVSSANPVAMLYSSYSSPGPSDRWQSISYLTLKRSFCVTLSNYEPKDGETMDDFIHRGMLDFYCERAPGSPPHEDTSSATRKIIGGFALRTQKIVSATNKDSVDSNKVTAYPLITRPSHWIASGSNPDRAAGYGWESSTYQKTYRGRPSYLFTGASGLQARTFLNGGAKLKQASGSASGYEPCVDLSFDEWINAKIVFDINEKNTFAAATRTGETDRLKNYYSTLDTSHVDLTTSPTTYWTKQSHARMCKVYFTKGTLTTDATDETETTDEAPSFYVYFPTREGAASETHANWSWMEKPEFWPNVLTVWANNFRYFTDIEATYAASGTSGGWAGGTGTWGVGRNVSTTLNGALTTGSTTIVLTDSSGLPTTAQGGGTIIISPGEATEEYVKYVTNATNTLGTLTRGRLGSATQAHDTGAAVVGGAAPMSDAGNTGTGLYDTGNNTPDGTDIFRDFYGLTNEYVPNPQDEDSDGDKDLGTGRQTKVYIDNIDFRNFNYEILNNSAAKGAFTIPSTFNPITVATPVSGGVAGASTRRTSEAANGGLGMTTANTLYTRNGPTYITLGFDSLWDLPIIGSQTNCTTVIGSAHAIGRASIEDELTPGTPLIITDGLTNTTNIAEDTIYYVSTSAGGSNKIRISNTLEKAFAGHYIGFGGTADTGLTVLSPGWGAAGWTMWNGFNQKNFQNNLYNDGWTTQAFRSMTSDGTNATGRTNDSFVSYYGGQNLNAGNTALASTYKCPATIQGLDIDFTNAPTGDGSEVDKIFFTTGTAGSGTLSTDGLSQKGTVYMSLSGNVDSWAKRENIFTSARIMAIPSFTEQGGEKVTDEIPRNAISVDNPSLFVPGDTTNGPFYVIYKSLTTGTDAQILGTGSVSGKRSQYLSVKNVDGPFIEFNEDYDSDNLVNIANLPFLWCGPIKHWITFQMFPCNVNTSSVVVATDVSDNEIIAVAHGLAQGTPIEFSGLDNTTTPDDDIIYYVSETGLATDGFDISTNASGGSSGDVSFAGSDDTGVVMTVYNIAPYESGTQGGGKSYDNIAILSNLSGDKPALADTGSTWNEFEYFYNTTAIATGGRSATYGNPWLLDVTSGSNIELGTDYGQGAYDDEKGEGGQVDVVTPYVGKFTDFNVNGLITQNGLMPNDNFKMLMNLKNPTVNQKVEFVNADYNSTDKDILKPHYLWTYFDAVPLIDNFKVSPLFKLLPDKENPEPINLYELTTQDLRALHFSWEEEAEDTWYRMLMIDASGASIHNKYHKARMHVPFNEEPSSPVTAPTSYVYNYATSGGPAVASGTITVGSECRSLITGIQGYTIQTASSSTATNGVSVVPHTVTYTGSETFVTSWQHLTEWTLVVHLTPSANDRGHDAYFLANGTDIEAYILGSNGHIRFVLNGQTVESVSEVSYDGRSPTSMIVTYDANATDGRYLKLYIDGVLEDVDTNTYTVTSAYNTTIGAQDTPSNTSAYRGTIEEVILYEKAYEVPHAAGSFVFKNAILADKNSDNNYLTHSAKLFCMDYTNIRGTTPQEVGTSKQTNWKVTTV